MMKIAAFLCLIIASFVPKIWSQDVVGPVPYQVAVSQHGSFICSGALIAPRTVLTSANCVYRYENTPTAYSVIISSTSPSTGPIQNVSSIVRHPLFVYSSGDYDLALLHLDGSEENRNSSIIIKDDPIGIGSLVQITGWGRRKVDTDLEPEAHLQLAANLPVISHQECADRYSFPIVTTDRFLCILWSPEVAITKDPGSPVVQDGRLVGIVSDLLLTADNTGVNAYTALAPVHSWIRTNMNSSGLNRKSAWILVFANLLMTILIWWKTK